MEINKITSLRYFSICSCLILLLGIVNHTISPKNFTYMYEKKVGEGLDMIRSNCKRYYDELKDLEVKKDTMAPDDYENEYDDKLYNYKICVIQKGTFAMERISFNLNIIIGFICLLLDFFAYKGKRIPLSSLIGLICGFLGIVSTLLYIIFSEILFTQFYPKYQENEKETFLLKRESDGSFAEYEEGRGFRCYYYSKKGDFIPFYAKYSDIIKSQYNFNRELIESYNDPEKSRCTKDYDIKECAKNQYITITEKYKNCKKLYYKYNVDDYKDEDDYYLDYYLLMFYDISIKLYIAMILSAFLIPIYAALTLFSFNLSEGAKKFKQDIVRAEYLEDLNKNESN